MVVVKAAEVIHPIKRNKIVVVTAVEVIRSEYAIPAFLSDSRVPTSFADNEGKGGNKGFLGAVGEFSNT